MSGSTFQKKLCDFFIYGHSEITGSKVLQIASLQNYNMTAHIGKDKHTTKIEFPNSNNKETYIMCEWHITEHLNVGFEAVTEADRVKHSIVPRDFVDREPQSIEEANLMIDELKQMIEVEAESINDTKNEVD